MPKVLIVFGSSQGQSEKIAGAIAAELRRQGVESDLVNSRRAPPLGPGYDGVVAGASVHAGRFQRSLVKWVRANAAELAVRPSAFYSVCLGILQPDPAVQRQEQRIIESFFRHADWHPGYSRIFAGALSYTKLGFFSKRLLRWIARKNGGGTDLSRDYEYTDWREVRRFANAFAERVKASAA